MRDAAAQRALAAKLVERERFAQENLQWFAGSILDSFSGANRLWRTRRKGQSFDGFWWLC